MNKEEMIEVILAYEKELIENYKENAEAFGHTDKDTERAFSKWNVIDELLERLNIKQKYEEVSNNICRPTLELLQ